MIYPWHKDVWQHLIASREKLPHALLFRGKGGTGKFDFARTFANYLLCQQPTDSNHACGACASCNWFSQYNHPDYRLLTPDQETVGESESPAPAKTGKKSQISVAQVRELGNFLELTSHRDGGLRIVLIHPAESMNAASANALLKVLEEPASQVVFMLVSSQPQRLLPTIVSRCRKIDMPIPGREQALEWLQANGVQDADNYLSHAGGSPLSAMQDAEEGTRSADTAKLLARGAQLDPFAVASQMAGQGMESATSMLQKWIYDLIASRLANEVRYFVPHANALQGLSKSVDLGLLLDFQRRVDASRKSATHPLNHELQLENLLLQYTQLFSR
jgi:DNA polymerase-3 subunit delta'